MYRRRKLANKIKPTNFVSVSGWMVTELGLKGNSLLIYATIYGFSQGDSTDHCYRGSIDYLADWASTTRQGVIRILNKLVGEGLIRKIESKPTNIYIAVGLETYLENKRKSETQKILDPSQKILDETLRKSETETQKILDNNIKNKYIKTKSINEKIEEIITYLNKVCHTTFKVNNSSTKKLIKRRLADGFTVDDFKKVIDLKYLDWGENPHKFNKNTQYSNEFLRPSTLFGDKFETYVYEALSRESSEEVVGVSSSTEVDPDVSDLEF